MEILKAIESVEHENEGAMFALNEKVYEWLLKINPDQKYGMFVSSRDALKAIRPEGWTFRNLYHYPKPDGEFGFVMTNNPENKIEQYQVVGISFQSEELAELHAIIQTIQYERKNHENTKLQKI